MNRMRLLVSAALFCVVLAACSSNSAPKSHTGKGNAAVPQNTKTTPTTSAKPKVFDAEKMAADIENSPRGKQLFPGLVVCPTDQPAKKGTTFFCHSDALSIKITVTSDSGDYTWTPPQNTAPDPASPGGTGYGKYTTTDDPDVHYITTISRDGDPDSRLARLLASYMSILGDDTPLSYITVTIDNTTGHDPVAGCGDFRLEAQGGSIPLKEVGTYVFELAVDPQYKDAADGDNDAITIYNKFVQASNNASEVQPGTKVQDVFVLEDTSIPEPSGVWCDDTQMTKVG